jgi:hypothetical protein
MKRALGCICAQLFQLLFHVLHDVPRKDADLLRRLQSPRVDPVVQMGCRIGLIRFTEQFVSQRSGWKELGGFTSLFCEPRETISER